MSKTKVGISRSIFLCFDWFWCFFCFLNEFHVLLTFLIKIMNFQWFLIGSWFLISSSSGRLGGQFGDRLKILIFCRQELHGCSTVTPRLLKLLKNTYEYGCNWKVLLVLWLFFYPQLSQFHTPSFPLMNKRLWMHQKRKE